MGVAFQATFGVVLSLWELHETPRFHHIDWWCGSSVVPFEDAKLGTGYGANDTQARYRRLGRLQHNHLITAAVFRRTRATPR
jgi:hypothetical protein